MLMIYTTDDELVCNTVGSFVFHAKYIFMMETYIYEHGHTRLPTGSSRQVHMEEAGILLLII